MKHVDIDETLSDNEPWMENFFQTPIVKRIVANVNPSDYGMNVDVVDHCEDAEATMYEICHGIQAFANDYSSPNQELQSLWGILREVSYSDMSDHNWENNEYGKAVYDFLENEYNTNGFCR